MMMMYRWMAVFGLAAGLAAGAAPAQVRVVKGERGKVSLDLSGFAAGAGTGSREFVQTLREDLTLRSGYFTEAAPGRAELTLTGAVAGGEGGRLRAECVVQGAVTQQKHLAKAYMAADANPRRFAHQVADAIVLAVTGKPGMASGRLALVGTRSGKKELYLCDSDGHGVFQLTHDGTVSVAPKWGPQNQIVYTSYLKGYPDVYLVNVVTGSRQRISSYAGLNAGADLSPDGREVALVLSKDGNPELYIKHLGDGRLTRLTQTRQVAEASPSWSPDGRQIVYVSDSSGRPHLYLIGREGGRPRRLNSFGSENVAPDWGGNGRIAYCTRQGGRYQVAVYDPASGESQVLDTADGANYESPSWAPDGRHIACTRTQAHRRAVYLLDTLGDPPIALLADQGDWYSPTWSP